jgi:hypothetical protein
MTAPAFEEVPMPEPDSFLFQHDETGLTQFVDAQQVEWGFEKNNPRWKRVSEAFTADQLRAYGDQRANAALEEAAKLRKLIADHNDECVRMCDSRFANGPTQCPMRAYNRQCPDCPKDGMVDLPAIKKENGDADQA